MSRRPLIPETPSPADPPPPHRDGAPRIVQFDEAAIINAVRLPPPEAIEAVARRMCEFRGLNPDATEYGYVDQFGPHDKHLFLIRNGSRKMMKTSLEKNWRRFYYQAADALIAAQWLRHG